MDSKKLREVLIDYNSSDYLQIRKYMIFEQAENERYVILNLYNSYSQAVKASTITMLEFDADGNEIKSTDLSFEKIYILKGQDIVPYQKFKISYRTVKIEFKVQKIRFETHTWEAEKLTKVVGAVLDTKKKIKQPKKHKVKLQKDQKIDKSKFEMKRTRTHWRFWYLPILFVICLGCASAAMYYSIKEFKGSYTYFDDNTFDYHILNDKEATINKYLGTGGIVVIPENMGEYKIVGIENNAFENSKVIKINATATDISVGDNAFNNCLFLTEFKAKSITKIGEGAFSSCKKLDSFVVESVASVGKNAFDGCEALTSISLPECTSIKENAFNGCEALYSFSAPKAVLDVYALKDCKNVKSISFDSTTSSDLGIVFNKNDYSVITELESLECNMSYISKAFFSGYKIKKLALSNNDIVVEKNALKELGATGYTITEHYEAFDGKLLNVFDVPENGELEINGNISSISSTAFKEEGYKIYKLTLKGSKLVIDKNALSGCANVNELILGSTVSVDEGALSSLSLLEKINMPVTGKTYTSLFTYEPYVKELIINSGTIPAGYFNGVSRLEKLTILDGADAAENSLSGVKSITTIECTTDHNIGEMVGYSNSSITHVIVIEGSVLPSKYFSGLSSLKSVEYKTTIKELEDNVFENNTGMGNAVIPSTVTKMTMPVIGDGCDHLNRVEAPFIGKSKTEPVEYAKFNLSYSETENLIVGYDLELGIADLSCASKLHYLCVDGVVSGKLDSIPSLFTLEMDYNPGASTLASYYKNGVPSSLETVILHGSGVLPGTYFSGCSNVRNIALYDFSNVEANVLKDCLSLNNVYVTKGIDVNLIAGSTPYATILCEGEAPTSLYRAYSNISRDKETKVEYNNNTYIAYGVFVVDVIKVLGDDYSNLSNKYYSISSVYTAANAFINLQSYTTFTAYDASVIVTRVNYDGNGNTSVTHCSNDEYISSTATYNENKLFAGWYADEELTTPFDFDKKITANTTMYGKWFDRECTNVLDNRSYTVTKANMSYEYVSLENKTVELMVITNDLMSLNVYENGEYKSITYDNNISLHKYTINMKAGCKYTFIVAAPSDSFTATLVLNTSTETKYTYTSISEREVFTVYAVAGKSFTVPTVYRSGKTFVGWYDSNGNQVTDSQGNKLSTYYSYSSTVKLTPKFDI